MSLMWRKGFFWRSPPVPPETLGEPHYRHVMAKPESGLPFKCSACPCPEGWYITTFCGCAECGDEYAKLGLYQSYEGQPITVDGTDRLCAFTMSLKYPAETRGIHGSVEISDSPKAVGVGCTLMAIKLETPNAPFTGTVKCTFYLDKSKIGEWSGTCTEGVPVSIGEGNTFHFGYPCDAVIVGTGEGEEFAYVKFDDVGVHELGVVVDFTESEPATHDPVHMEGLTAIRVFDFGDASFVGHVAVVPSWVINEEGGACAYETPEHFPTSASAMLGPYKTMEEADAVLTEYYDIIVDWAANCQCPKCDFVRDGLWQVIVDSESGLTFPYTVYDVCTTAGQQCVTSPVDCWRKLTYSVELDTGVEIELFIDGVKQDLDGADEEPKIFYIPPCANVEERVVLQNDSITCWAHFYCEELGAPEPCPYEGYDTLEDYLQSLEA